MGKLRQPIPLLKMSIDVLLVLLLEHCECIAAADGSAKDVSRYIVIFRDKICRYMPWYLLADFCRTFLDKFHSIPRLSDHREAALEIVMDIEIRGLRFEGPMTAYLDPRDARRMRELTALDMVGSWTSKYDMTDILQLLHLTELTSFKQWDCTDRALEIIGRECPKLEILCLPGSNRVTDIGLRNLTRCSSLRYVDVSESMVTRQGVNHLLSTNSKIDTLLCSEVRFEYRSSILSFLDPFVYPSMKSLVIRSSEPFTSAHLNRIVAKFPNLTSIRIYSVITGDLNALESLGKLKVIELDYGYYDEPLSSRLVSAVTWNNMEQLLRLIGTNITTLKLGMYERSFYFRQLHLNFMFNCCPNIEYLEFLLAGTGRWFVPSFQKLKELKCHQPDVDTTDEDALAVVEFDEMPALETLWLTGVQDLNLNHLVFDHKKFPNLTVLEIMIPNNLHVLAEIREMIKINNLDFEIRDYRDHWYE
ncbi:uncharacterized protein LOC105684476 [Athalia rosae]|uniref:uncharacterized protein LOC105684476 n=1 Tax=Athalia rosae TaxID=37344 RepID=UPI0020347A6C|nr:uncharacterized protein LOC105684476 [Athalia rosae]XP_048510214.1 uncharacterized protein LOC105684476 [Athalia rosae]XP_048510216.1 uncharacterized protein LOC105684476 [Athalia rosae]XP_048510217.1 uncharacterized protein LOC105684476 [Athalia rosae]